MLDLAQAESSLPPPLLEEELRDAFVGAEKAPETHWVSLRGRAADLAVSGTHAYAIDADGLIWRSPISEVRRGNSNSWSKQSGRFRRLRATHDGSMWGLTKSNLLYRYSGSLWRPVAEQVRDVAASPDGIVWLLRSDGGLTDLMGNRPFLPLPPDREWKAESLQCDEHGLPWLWFPDGSILRFDGTGWQQVATSSEGIRSFSIGLSGTVFAARNDGALLQFQMATSRWVVHALQGGKESPPARDVAVDQNGYPWLIAPNGNLFAELPVRIEELEEKLSPAVFTRLLNWKAAGTGAARQISVGEDGTVFSLAPDGSIWQWQEKGIWKPITGKMVHIAAGSNGSAWGIDGQGGIQALTDGFWRELDGRARLIAVAPGNHLWALLSNNTLSELTQTTRQWKLRVALTFRIRWLAVSSRGEPWVIDDQGIVRLFQNGEWITIPGIEANTLDVGSEGTVYATTPEHRIYWLEMRDMKWKPATGEANQIDVGPSGAPWIVTPENRIKASDRFFRDHEAKLEAIRLAEERASPRPPVLTITWPLPTQNQPLTFQQLPNSAGMQDIGIGSNGAVYAVGADGSLQCFSNPDRSFKLASRGNNQRITVNPDGNPWILADSGIISFFEKGSWQIVPGFTGGDLSSSPDGTIWAAGSNGASYRYSSASQRFELVPITRSTTPFKLTRIAGVNRNNFWSVGDAHQLMSCEKGACSLQLVGASDVALAPDGTVFALDLLGRVQRYNARQKKFEVQNGQGIALSVGPQGLPWLITNNGRISYAGLFFPLSKSINTATCATAFARSSTPQPRSSFSLKAVDDLVSRSPGGLIAILANDSINGMIPNPGNVNIALNSNSNLLRLSGDSIVVSNLATIGSTLTASYKICPRQVFGGCAQANISVRVSGTPDAPTAVSAAAGNALASISFSPPLSDGTNPIIGYTVTASPGGKQVNGTSSPITVTGLANGTAYTFTVTASNAIGTGPASLPTAAVTPLSVSGAPVITSATATNAQAQIAFTPPTSTGGAQITGYLVTASPGGMTANSTTSPITITGLSNGTPYTFTVAAINAVGIGPASAPSPAVVPQGLPGAPSAVIGVAGNTQAQVSFTAPANNGSTITSYTIRSTPGGLIANGTASPIMVTGLTNGTAYTFTVTATNGVGTGPASIASAPVTPQGVPDAPTAVAAIVGNGQADISFTAPANNGSAITGYTVTSAPGGLTATSAGSPITMNGLINGTAYTFTVRATNAVGTGPASFASQPVIPQGLPGTPTNVIATGGNSQAQISFAAASNGSPITSYTVTSAPGGLTTTGTASPLTVNGLTNGTAYTFTVTATNAVGTSPASTASAAVTPTGVPNAPTAVAAVAGNAQAQVSFTSPAANGSPITSYTVTSTPGGLTATGAASPLTVNGLTNGTAYTFTVTATNAVGTSPASTASAAVTPTGVPNAPTVVAAIAGNAQAQVSFTAPAANGSPITGYTVTSTPGGLTSTGGASPLTVNGLTNGTAYTFTVTATNAVGTGPASTASAAVTPTGVPNAPTVVAAIAGNAQAQVSFTSPAANGSPITSYTVTSTPGGLTATGAASPLTVNGLTNGTAYTFTVTATNAVGTSPASTAFASVTPTGVPNAPTAVAAVVGNAQAQVSFTAPATNGSPITSYTVTSTPGGLTSTGGASPLTVNGLTNGTAYTFTVTATNAVGTGPASTASAAVTPTGVPNAPTTVTAVAGNAQAQVSFTAPAANGSPITSYTVTSNPGGLTATGAASPLTVNGLTNGTAYTFTVTATNAVGTSPASTASAAVTPTGVPNAPTAVAAVAGNAQAQVSFIAPAANGSPITSYTVTSTPGGLTATGVASPLTVNGLTNGTAYTFTVTATNAVGTSPASAASATATPTGVPNAPTAVTAVAGNAQAQVSFTAPAANGSPITSYTVTSNPGGLTATGTASPIQITGLTNGTAYTFTVTATNAVGTGPASTPSIAATPMGLPGAPTAASAVAGDTTAQISFTAPANNGGSAITSYTVTSTPGGLTATGAASPLTVNGLTNGTAYTFTLTATNAVGTGPVSTASAAVTPTGVPNAPTAVAAVAGNAQAQVSFTAPAANGSPITSYTVTSNPGGLTATGTASPLTVNGLTNGTAYTFTVTATNAVGTGPASTASASVTPIGVPNAPTAVAAVAGNTQAQVSFIAPAANGSPITSYTVTSTPGGLTATGVASPLTVNGLTNGTAYTFTVTATNAVGTSPASAASAAATPTGVPNAPTAVTAVAGNAQAQVSFTAPAANGSPITGYTVTSTPGGLTATGVASPLTVNGLTNGTAYTFTVTATNAVGASPASTASAAVTPAGLPGAPIGVAASPGDSLADIFFSAPISNGGSIITNYTITSTPGGLTATGAASPIQITGLTNGTAYTFTVTATNAVGTGAASTPSIAATPMGLPGAPTAASAVAGDTTTQISFTAPANNGGSAITSYTVTSNPGGLTATGAASPITITGLTNGTAYSFTVTATNAVGTGPASAPSNAVTPQGVPGAPTAVVATAGDSQASIAFTPPVSNGGSPITSYSVTSSPGGLTVTGAASPLVLSGLTNGAAYSFTVTATNAVGTGLASAPSNTVTPQGVPGAPTAVVATAGDAQASIAFTPPLSNGGSAIIGYTVTSNPGGLTVTGAASPLVLSGLTNGTGYSFTVTATNAVGTGLASAPSNAVTPQGVPGAPISVAAIPGDGYARISFSPPVSDGGNAITAYTVTSNPGGLTASGPASPLTINGLTNGTAYSFTVTATNGIGTGTASAPSPVITPAGLPGAPAGVVAAPGDGYAVVSFAAPAFNGGSAISGYTVTATPGGLSATGAASPIQITGLTNGTAYTFTVTATNAVGTGLLSAASLPATPLGVPGSPTALSAFIDPQLSQVYGTFAAPLADGGSPVTQYNVELVVAGGTIMGTNTFASPPAFQSMLVDATTFCAQSLLAGTLNITAINAVGSSAAVSMNFDPAIDCPPPLPGQPTNVVAVAGDGYAVISFTPPAGTVTDYMVNSSPIDQMGFGTASPITVSGLLNGVSYTFTVTANNMIGSGTPSAASNAVIPTGPTGVPTAPTITGAVPDPVMPNVITVSYTPPVNTGSGPVTTYNGYGVDQTWGLMAGSGTNAGDPLTTISIDLTSGCLQGAAGQTLTVDLYLTGTNISGTSPASAIFPYSHLCQ